MAERLIIEVTEKGARVVSGKLKGIGSTAKTAATGVGILNRALGLIGAAATIRGLSRMSDEFTNMTNRLKLVTTDTSNLNAVQSELVRISTETRTSLSANAELFTRTALATKELGLSQQQTLEFTEALSQATILSGASSIEASNAIRQLTQGLSSGQLRGEEFRAVAEQLPLVLEILAEDLDITRGELRKMAFEGKISADILVGAMLRASNGLKKDFGKTIPTIGQAMEVFRTRMTAAVGEFNKFSDLGAGVASTILLLSKNIGILARVAGAAVLGVALKSAVNGVKALTLAIAANPIGFLTTALTLAITTLITFSDKLKISSDGMATLADFAVVSFNTLAGIIETVFNGIFDALPSLSGSFKKVFGDIEFSFTGILRFLARGLDNLIAVFQGTRDAIVAAFKNLPKLLADIFVRTLNAVIKLVESSINTIVRAINSVTSFVGIEAISPVALSRVTNNFESAGNAVGEAFVKGFSEGGAGAEELLDSVLGAAESRAQARQAKIQLEKFQQEQTNLGVSGPAGLPGGEGGLAGGLKKPKTALDGFSAGLKKVGEEINDFSSQAEATIVNAFGNAEDAMVGFVKTGKLDFGALVDSILEDLTRLVFRQALSGLFGGAGGGGGGAGGLLGGLFGGGGGGGGGLLGGLFGGLFAEGGTLRAGQTGIVGDGGEPELIQPGVTSTITPVSALAPAKPPVVNIVNVTDPNDVASALNTAEGEKLIVNVIQRNRDAINGMLA